MTPREVCDQATLRLQTAASLYCCVGDAYKELVGGVLRGALPMPAQPIDVTVEICEKLEDQLREFRELIETLREHVSPELTAEIAREMVRKGESGGN